ncbi:MAG: hypothetical protein QOI10_2701 [Solirubrobacterales bacterium]|nr:hypothetical protein [Solirubrobacterales bacterium]
MAAAVCGAVALPASAAATVRAGAAVADASWHVGASAGQYASDGTFGVDPDNGTYDPTTHSIRRANSYGIQSRLEVRALVIEGPSGNRIAIAKTDQYIPQDLLYRRAAQLLESEGDCGITAQTLTMTATHDHSSPMYSSTSWGVWAFQDVFDVRFYNYLSRQIFTAVERACDRLVPVRVGAAVGQFDKTHRHSFGPAIGDDGTPAGYPFSNTDHALSIVRFDDISDPEHPKPVANLVNWSGHPEMLEGNDLIAADYIGPAQRMLDRATGAVTVWTQGAVGTAEPERSSYHSVHERLEFSHKDYAQAEYAAHLLTGKLLDVWHGIGADDPPDRDRYIPFMSDFPVQMTDHWYPGPFSHPYPGVSNCRADRTLAGEYLLPVIGLPDCSTPMEGLRSLADLLGLPDPPVPDPPPIDPGLSTDDFEALGIPVPENYGAPGYSGLEEDIDVHLQGIRLGELYLPICACEQWYDQSKNIETRTDRIAGDEYLGYDWGARCTATGDGTYAADGSGTGTWTCPNPNDTSQPLPPISDLHYERMRAQVNNPANGWNDLSNVHWAESEPANPQLIKGNYTHDDDATSAALGYDLTIPISMANDYNGYIATYREYQRGDHYRKALTGWGPHSSDYLATRLAYIGRQMHDPNVALPADMQTEALLAPKTTAELALNDARAEALGTAGQAAVDAYEAALPDDAPAAVVAQPADVERFDAALFTWNGGSNFTDNPVVTVERETAPGVWTTYADQSGELPVTLEFPHGEDVASYLSGDQAWHWTAHFEAFVAPFDTGSGSRATPAGNYRFVVHGIHRSGGAPVPYDLTSDAFEVRPWSGITIDDMRLNDDRSISFRVGPRSTYTVGGPDSDVDVNGGGPTLEAEVGPIDYPDSYDSPTRFIDSRRTAYRDPGAPGDQTKLEWFCFDCSFRPWLDAGDAAQAFVTIRRAGSGALVDRVPASRDGDRWLTARGLRPNEVAAVEPGDVTDAFGDYNGAASAQLSGGAGPPEDPPADPPTVPPADPPAVPPAEPEPPAPADGDGTTSAGGDEGGDATGGDSAPPTAACAHLVRGSAKGEVLRGTALGDRIEGRGGADELRGGGGDDCLDGGGGRDVIRCGAGDDVATVSRRDTVHGCERVYASSG